MERQTVWFTDFSKAEPASAMSTQRTGDKWELVPYETYERSGTMLVSLQGGRAPAVTIDPQLSGWYAIYICLGAYSDWGTVNFNINVRLSGEPCFETVHLRDAAQNLLEESLFRCADLTGQTIELSQFKDYPNDNAIVAWFKFVPMTDEQVRAYQGAISNEKTRSLYATHDMHAELFHYCPENPQDWTHIAEDYRNSDVGYLSIENIYYMDGPITEGQDPETYPFFRPTDGPMQKKFHYYNDDAIRAVIDRGHEIGLQMHMSMRMGLWTVEFPFDRFYFDNQFYVNHPEFWMRNRDGAVVNHMSFIYDEVQEFFLDHFSRMAAFDVEGVEMLWNRGAPFLLFEPPFVEAFQAKYGIDPCLLPLEDPRMIEARCEILTNFVRKLRDRLTKERAARGQKPVKLYARGLLNIDDWKVMGLDVERWCEEGLVDGVISYGLQIRENLSHDVWSDTEPGLLDLKKYTHVVRTSKVSITEKIGDFRFVANNETDYAARFYIPVEERVRQWQALEEKTGVPVWHDIMPRQLEPEEYKARASELYAAGAKRFSLWDSYERAPVKARSVGLL